MKVSKLIKRLTKDIKKQAMIDKLIDEYPGYYVPYSEIKSIIEIRKK